MFKGILVSALIITLAVGLVIPMTGGAYANYFKIKAVNKLNSNEVTSCSNAQNVGTVVSGGSGGKGPLQVNCSLETNDGTTYSASTLQPYLKWLKTDLQDGSRINVKLFDTGVEEGSLLDSYVYTVHDLANIGEVQIRLCSGPQDDSICHDRIIVERP